MTILSMRVVAGLVASAVVGSMATASKAEEVTVTGSRFLETPIGINYTGMSIKDVSLSTSVSVTDLDLASSAGLTELDRRVNAAARASCREIASMYPVSHPETAACAKAAADKSMSRVRKLLAAHTGSA
jgi:UrcA family protein